MTKIYYTLAFFCFVSSVSAENCYTCKSFQYIGNEDICSEVSDKTPRTNSGIKEGCVKFEGRFVFKPGQDGANFPGYTLKNNSMIYLRLPNSGPNKESCIELKQNPLTKDQLVPETIKCLVCNGNVCNFGSKLKSLPILILFTAMLLYFRKY